MKQGVKNTLRHPLQYRTLTVGLEEGMLETQSR
jgi:hypothetical protein